MTPSDYRPSVPGDWFVDPVRLGVPGLRPQGTGPQGTGPQGARPQGAGIRGSNSPESESLDDALAWQSDALCAQTDPEAFFPEKGGSTRDAKKICTTCEVKGQCLEYALQNDERFGIWGGLSERERRRLRRTRTA